MKLKLWKEKLEEQRKSSNNEKKKNKKPTKTVRRTANKNRKYKDGRQKQQEEGR